MKGERVEEEGKEGERSGMMTGEAQAIYLLYVARRLYLPRGPRPNFQPWSAITPRSRRTSCAAVRPGKWKIGGSKRAGRAHNRPHFPARMSARSRANRVETYPVG